MLPWLPELSVFLMIMFSGRAGKNHLMQPEELKQAIQKIKMWQRGGERAPHKPLLLLYALGRLTRGEPRQMNYKEVKDDLKNLLDEFGPPRANQSPSYPFIRLCNDFLPQTETAIWQIEGREHIVVRRAMTPSPDRPTRDPSIHILLFSRQYHSANVAWSTHS
jgi:hypothetical protein